MARVGLYGGSFNPPHLGHQATILRAVEIGELDCLLVVPVFKHPDGKELVPYDDRMVMTKMICKPFSYNITVQDYERQLADKGGDGLTITLLNWVLANVLMPEDNDKLVLVLGSDIKPVFQNWKGHTEIQALIDQGKIEVCWIERSGAMSSTFVRAALRLQRSTKNMLPRRVRRYIDEKGLYAHP